MRYRGVTLHDRGGGWYALQALDGRWVMAHNNGGGFVTATATMIGNWEEFQAIPAGGGYALRTSSGYYLTASWYTPMISAVATTVGPWEIFHP